MRRCNTSSSSPCPCIYQYWSSSSCIIVCATKNEIYQVIFICCSSWGKKRNQSLKKKPSSPKYFNIFLDPYCDQCLFTSFSLTVVTDIDISIVTLTSIGISIDWISTGIQFVGRAILLASTTLIRSRSKSPIEWFTSKTFRRSGG